MTLKASFANTQVSVEKSISEIDRLLGAHGVRESRHTHIRPLRLANAGADTGPETCGRLVFEFVYLGRDESERRGVRVAVGYQPLAGPRGGTAGTTAEMAARALFWFLKAKFDSIDYGIEEFDVAFMPHLVTALGETFAERPALIASATQRPESLATLALPRPVAAEVVR